MAKRKYDWQPEHNFSDLLVDRVKYEHSKQPYKIELISRVYHDRGGFHKKRGQQEASGHWVASSSAKLSHKTNFAKNQFIPEVGRHEYFFGTEKDALKRLIERRRNVLSEARKYGLK